jgi:hypothetical protein
MKVARLLTKMEKMAIGIRKANRKKRIDARFDG